MAEQDPEKKGFCLNKAEQISRIWHNFTDGAYKLVIIIGVVIALVVGGLFLAKVNSTVNSTKEFACEWNPFCDTESEAAAKAEKARLKAERQLEKERAAAAAAAAEAAEEAAEAAARAEAEANGEEQPGKWQRFKGWASSKMPGGDD